MDVWREALAKIEAETLYSPTKLKDFTWGEFLLYFLPATDDDPNITHLSVPHPSVLPEEALLQLVVPEQFPKTSIPHDMSYLTPLQLRREVLRLARERSYLMWLVQDDALKLASREAQLRKGLAVHIEGLETRVAEYAKVLEAAEKEMEGRRMKEESLRNEVVTLRERLKDVEERTDGRYRGFVREIEARNREEVASLKESLKEAETNLDKAQTEVGNLRRENAKLMVSQRGLERDLIRGKDKLRREHAEQSQELKQRVQKVCYVFSHPLVLADIRVMLHVVIG